MKSLTVSTKKFTQTELKMMIKVLRNRSKAMIEANALFEDFVTSPTDPKWKNGKVTTKLPQELIGIVSMFSQLMGEREYQQAVQEFVEPHRFEENAKLEELAICIVKLEMRLK